MISFLGLDKKIPNSIGKVDRLSSKRMEKRPLPKKRLFGNRRLIQRNRTGGRTSHLFPSQCDH